MRKNVPQTAALRTESQVDQLDYMRAMIRELREMAAADRHDMIALHLEMAYIEACDKLRELHAVESMSPRQRKKPARQLAKSS